MMNISNRHMELTDVVAALGASENLAKGTYEWVAGVTEVDDGTRPPGSRIVLMRRQGASPNPRHEAFP